MSFDAVGDLRQIFFCQLQEMRSGAMALEGGIVLVLFIEEEPARICLVLMHLIHEASRLFARFGCELVKDCHHVRLASDFCHPSYGQHHHPSLRSPTVKSGPKIVCSRSGPVEIIPTCAPVSFSMKARYSRAALGNASNVRIACVGLAQ